MQPRCLVTKVPRICVCNLASIHLPLLPNWHSLCYKALDFLYSNKHSPTSVKQTPPHHPAIPIQVTLVSYRFLIPHNHGRSHQRAHVHRSASYSGALHRSTAQQGRCKTNRCQGHCPSAGCSRRRSCRGIKKDQGAHHWPVHTDRHFSQGRHPQMIPLGFCNALTLYRTCSRIFP